MPSLECCGYQSSTAVSDERGTSLKDEKLAAIVEYIKSLENAGFPARSLHVSLAWKVSLPFMYHPEYQFFEYACHEGNYAMRNILSAARTEDKK